MTDDPIKSFDAIPEAIEAGVLVQPIAGEGYYLTGNPSTGRWRFDVVGEYGHLSAPTQRDVGQPLPRSFAMTAPEGLRSQFEVRGDILGVERALQLKAAVGDWVVREALV